MEPNAWTIDEGITDPAAFFTLLPDLLPDATHLEIEGERLAPEARAIYVAHADGTPLRTPRQTLSWSRRFRCPVSPALLGGLSLLAAECAPAQLLDHLAVYADDRLLLFWHDAFANALVVAPVVPEARAQAPCSSGRSMCL